MSGAGAALAAAAEDLVGTPFRLHGRDSATGLDCVGVVTAALAALNRKPNPPSGYELRQSNVEPLLGAAVRCGLTLTVEPIAPGDVILVRAGPAQHHLLVVTRAGGFIHAHAALRRVVHSPAPLPWPELRRWRLAG